jgi:hypothetical protein
LTLTLTRNESRFADDEAGCQGSVTRVYINMATINWAVCASLLVSRVSLCVCFQSKLAMAAFTIDTYILGLGQRSPMGVLLAAPDCSKLFCSELTRSMHEVHRMISAHGSPCAYYHLLKSNQPGDPINCKIALHNNSGIERMQTQVQILRVSAGQWLRLLQCIAGICPGNMYSIPCACLRGPITC